MDSAPSEFKGRLSNDCDWREIVAWIGDLAPMPQVASRALALVGDPAATSKELSDLLQTDPALAVRVLKIANSAMFSRQREITTLNQAVMVIGFKSLKGIIVAATLKELQKSQTDLDKMVWEASMAGAVASTHIARKLGRRYIEEVFLLGLLHNLGQFVLLTKPETAKDYETVLKRVQDDGIDFVTAEQEVFGFSHTLIGALVCKKWNFPPEVCQAILHYKDPWSDNKPTSEEDDKSAVIAAGELLIRKAGLGTPASYPDQTTALRQLLVTLGLDSAKVDVTIDELQRAVTDQFTIDRSVFDT